jgi:hypothetical protein
MSRFRGAAALLAAVALMAPVGTAAGATTRLSPTPPVRLPAHLSPKPRPAPPAKPGRPRPLPNTGIALLPELFVAASLLGLGTWARVVAIRRPQ